MGATLVKLYKFAEDNGGVTAKMRLAMITAISSQKASSTADTPELIAKFKAAIKQITGKDASV